jgi:hypothetical protein
MFNHNQAIGGACNRGVSADRNEIGVAFGGAVFGAGTVSNSTLTDNQAVGGADNLPSTGSTSLSTGVGGAIGAGAGQLTVTNSTIPHNEAIGGAGSPGGCTLRIAPRRAPATKPRPRSSGRSE